MKKTTPICMLLTLVILAGCQAGPGPVTDPLQEVCKDLGITGECKGVVILSQAAHLDWDWLNWFSTNVDGSNPVHPYFPCGMECKKGCSPEPANCIFEAANQLLATEGYYYSVCEMAFLRAFAETSGSSFPQMKTRPGLRIVGGGITSPDSLLPTGEAFIRNYLVGKTWLDSVGLDWTGQVWVPDNFGHDSQLPIVLAAMGVEGIGFARIPGACDQIWLAPALDRSQLTAARLLGQIDGDPGGVDFFWQANDGSEVVAHWLQGHYSQGSNVAQGGNLYDNPKDQAQCQNQKYFDAGNPQIQAFIADNGPASPTPFIYVPVSNDFAAPVGEKNGKPELLSIVDTWNNGGNPPNGIAAMVATFDDYVRLVSQYEQQQGVLKRRRFHGSDDESFQPTPYWMGFYASRPVLKALHQEGTRILLAAETFAAVPRYIASGSEESAVTPSLFDIWDDLTPSTHHDYITGTSPDDVYNYQGTGKEQLADLKDVVQAGEANLTATLTQIAGKVPVSQPSVVAFNQLGWDRQGMVEVPADDAARSALGELGQTQTTDDTVLICATAPSLGYQVNQVGQSNCTDLGNLSVDFIPDQQNPEKIVLTNEYLRATISKATGWSIASLADPSQPDVSFFAGNANTLTFFPDEGSIYGFEYECGGTFKAADVTSAPDAQVTVEQGSLRIRITAGVTYSSQGFSSQKFTKQYTLAAGERILRMTTTGAAPPNTTVTVGFPFADNLDTMIHGTPYHWDFKTPLTMNDTGFGAAFEVTHDFVAVQVGGRSQGAIYHGRTAATKDPVTPGAVMAWAMDGSNLVGAILRNTPEGGYCGAGADGSDDAVHATSYAFRIPGGIPQGLAAGSSGTLLREARQYNTPLRGRLVSSAQTGSYPTSFSLASVAAPASAMLTAAKAGTANPDDLILRIYQPSNAAQTVQLNLAPALEGQPVRVVTALETSTDDGKAESATAGTTVISAPRAVTTVAIGKSSGK